MLRLQIDFPNCAQAHKSRVPTTRTTVTASTAATTSEGHDMRFGTTPARGGPTSPRPRRLACRERRGGSVPTADAIDASALQAAPSNPTGST